MEKIRILFRGLVRKGATAVVVVASAWVLSKFGIEITGEQSEAIVGGLTELGVIVLIGLWGMVAPLLSRIKWLDTGAYAEKAWKDHAAETLRSTDADTAKQMIREGRV